MISVLSFTFLKVIQHPVITEMPIFKYYIFRSYKCRILAFCKLGLDTEKVMAYFFSIAVYTHLIFTIADHFFWSLNVKIKVKFSRVVKSEQD